MCRNLSKHRENLVKHTKKELIEYNETQISKIRISVEDRQSRLVKEVSGKNRITRANLKAVS